MIERLEQLTFANLLQTALSRVPAGFDKREGSIIYDALAPSCYLLAEGYMDIVRVLNETFADTASREFLIRRASERGIIPYPATKAILKAEFNREVPIGARFANDELTYVVVEKMTEWSYKLEAEVVGSIGNGNYGTILPIDFIEGLVLAEITELLIPGEDEESTEALRQRYFDSLEAKAFGGNIADYKAKTNAIGGVGGVKVYPVWNGGGTVRLVIINSIYEKPSGELVETVQSTIDPEQNQGEGVGIAPIGHVVTVEGVRDKIIDVSTNLTLQPDYTWEDIEVGVKTAIDNYFLDLAKEWADVDNVVVRISQVDTRLLNVTGVVDVGGTTLNGLSQNIVLDSDEIAVRGAISG